jgi:hypothetical protein
MKHCWQTVNISDTNYTPVLAPTTHCDRLAVVSGVTANMQRTQSTGRGSGQNRLLVVAGVLATSNYSPDDQRRCCTTLRAIVAAAHADKRPAADAFGQRLKPVVLGCGDILLHIFAEFTRLP